MSRSTSISALRTVAAIGVFGIILLVPYYRTLKSLRNYEIRGQTMGTIYQVQVVTSLGKQLKKSGMDAKIDKLLVDINNWMSTYIPESDISRFNSAGHTNAFPVAADLAKVVKFASEVSEASGGAFDPTVGPLTLLWGFGRNGAITHSPDEEKIVEIKSAVGYGRLHVSDAPPALGKDVPGLELDLGAVAKGYGVDCVANLLLESGYSNVLVEIGGEIVALGYNQRKKSWRISIETPVLDAGVGEGRYRILLLSNKAVATSGDYRNYFKDGGHSYSHIIDPRTGRPVSNNVASVSVIADDCMTADALATALMVLGPEEGLKLLEKYPGSEGMFIIRNPDSTFSDRASQGFDDYVLKP